jgi:RNA polymerase sigma factor (sigma-70 family)
MEHVGAPLGADVAAVPDVARIDFCVSLLQDDFHRQGRSLSLRDVHRVVSRLKLSPEAAATVLSKVTGLLDSEQEPTTAAEPDQSDRPKVETPTTSPRRSETDLVSVLLSSCGERKLLSHAEEIALGRSYRVGRVLASAAQQTPECRSAIRAGEEAFNTLVKCNLRLVVSVAREYLNTVGMELVDLVHEGVLGLIRAVEKYDPELGFRFSTYATHWIHQRITRGIADRSRLIRLPVHIAQNLSLLRRKRRRLAEESGRQPSPNDLAQDMGLSLSHVLLLLTLERDVTSFDQWEHSEERSGVTLLPDPSTPDPYVQAERADEQMRLLRAVNQLDSRMKEIIIRRYGLADMPEETLEQVGQRFGITRERIRQIEKAAIERLTRLLQRKSSDGNQPDSASGSSRGSLCEDGDVAHKPRRRRWKRRRRRTLGL